MKRRDTPRSVPDLPHYVRVDLDTNGTHVFRIPSQAVSRAAVIKARSVVEEQDPAEQQIRMLFFGASLVGECWHHETHDLETVRGKRDAAEYGRDIHEELHEAGYQSGEINRLVAVVSEAVSASAMDRADIDARKDFGEAHGEAGNGSGSPSPRSTSKTRGRGTRSARSSAST